MSKDKLNTYLKHFYSSARKQDSSYCKASSIKTIRAAVDHHLSSSPHCKQLFLMRPLQRQIECCRCIFERPGSRSQVSHAQTGYHQRQASKAQLQRTVWFYLGLYFGRRGRENQRDLKKEMLVLGSTPQGMEYFEPNRTISANQRDDSDP